MKHTLFACILSTACVAAFYPQAGGAQRLSPCEFKDVPVELELLSPVSTATSKPGDTFLLNVKSPEMYNGAKIEARVRALVAPARGFGKGKPNIELEFDTFTVNTDTCAITGELRDVRNAQGVAHVDDEGRTIGHTSNKKRIGGAAAMALLGGLAGYAAGGGSGAAAGATLGAAAGFYLTATLTASGQDITFMPGSYFFVNVTGARPRN